MAEQYWIGGFFVDLSRNQITQNEQSQVLAPKALAVLTCLAENRGKVVSQEELLAKVWPNTVVSPNTLQRSIAQLRKALGDDGKVQVYIKTHAKQGYSLECDVRWQNGIEKLAPDGTKETSIDNADISDAANQAKTTTKLARSHPRIKQLSIAAAVLVLTIIGYQYLPSDVGTEQSSSLIFDQIRSLTATDDKEFDASYTPDGKYIVFHRYLDKQCVNKIWAKDVSTQEEILLTKDWGAYGRHSFSSDGKKLVFLAHAPCIEPVSQKLCFDLVGLDFDKALEEPQQPSVMLKCENTTVNKPIWLNNDTIALMQYYSRRWKLINYSMSENSSTDLFNLDAGSVIDYAYSTKDDLIAVTSVRGDGQYYVEMLTSEGNVLSSHPIDYPQEISKHRAISPNFDPLNNQLVFSTGRQLFSLSYDGKISRVSGPFSDKMMQPEFHPDGKSMLMIKGPYDSDIVLHPLDQVLERDPATETEQDGLNQLHSYSSFERSNLGEDHAMFQPGGDLIAFWSERSGVEQVWISDGEGPRQLTQFPLDTKIRGIDWASDGSSILVNANQTLTQVFLDARQKSILLEHPIFRLYQWDSVNNRAIVRIRIEGELKVVDYDLSRSEFNEISDKLILWALKTKDGRLIYKDQLDQFWQPGPVEAQRIEALGGQVARSKSFVVNGNVIYAINSNNQLWSYDLDSETFDVLGEVDKDVDYLTDINQTHLLMTLRVAAKKEVVELSIRE